MRKLTTLVTKTTITISEITQGCPTYTKSHHFFSQMN